MADTKDPEQQLEMLHKKCQELEKLSAYLKDNTPDCVSELNRIADDLDKVHKDATISSVAGSAAGIVGGVTTLIGLILAPVTFGASLIVSGAGIAVAVAGGVTGVSASIADTVITNQKCNEVNEKINKINDLYKSIQEVMSNIQKLSENIINSVKAHFPTDHVIEFSAKGAKGVFTGLKIGQLIQLRGVYRAAAQGTEIAVNASRVLKIASGILSAVFVGVDIGFLVYGSIELHKGAKTEEAKKMREIASKIEEKLHEMQKKSDNLLTDFRDCIL